MTQPRQDQAVLSDALLTSPFAEAYRTLRANINFSSIDQPLKTILVTSAAPREGKTTTVVNLGVIMAQAGRRVVIVDADFRRPGLHHVLGIIPNGNRPLPGMSNAIVGQASLDQVVLPTAFRGLSLVPAGVLPPNPAELLGSQRMVSVVEQLGKQYDVVLLDSPPCLLYADAVILSRMADGVLYVLRAGVQDKAAQRRVQKQLQQAKARILGVVFNGADVEESASSYSYYYPNRQTKERPKEEPPARPKRLSAQETQVRELAALRERIAALESATQGQPQENQTPVESPRNP
jgi:capsular exopolysaccharide synthesis family protein